MEQKKFEFNGEATATYDNTGLGMNSSCGCGCDMGPMNMGMPAQTMMCPPIQECPQERVCHRYLCYEVPHIMPCNTRVINHHVYRHTYTPCYSTCEENVVSNVYDRKCCF